MKATEQEFRFRFWIILAIFLAAFAAYQIDPLSCAAGLARWLHATLLPSIDFLPLFHGVLLGGAVLVAAGACLRTWAGAYLHSRIVHDSALHTEGLVADGPFRFVRNPLYLGLLLLAVGFGLEASRLGWAFLMVALWLFLQRLIAREEHALGAAQGAAYNAYRAAVPRLIPSLRPRLPASGQRPEWGQAFLGEIRMWLFAIIAFVFAITLEARVIMWGVIVALVPYFVVQRATQLRSGRPDHDRGSTKPSLEG